MQSQMNNQKEGGEGPARITLPREGGITMDGTVSDPAESRRHRTTERQTGEGIGAATPSRDRFATQEERDEATRTLLLHALRHAAADDAVTELLFEHVVKGRHHWAVVANSLAPILEEVVEVADPSDWSAATDHVLDPKAQPADPDGSRRSERGTVFGIGLIRDFLRTIVEEPIVCEGLRHRPEVGNREVAPALRAATVKEELSAALRSGTEEDWNIIAGQLIAEAREVCGPAAAAEVTA